MFKSIVVAASVLALVAVGCAAEPEDQNGDGVINNDDSEIAENGEDVAESSSAIKVECNRFNTYPNAGWEVIKAKGNRDKAAQNLCNRVCPGKARVTKRTALLFQFHCMGE